MSESRSWTVRSRLLARIVLREHVSALQWAGIGLILAGVATLSALQA